MTSLQLLPRPRHHNRGFTLPEVVVALTLTTMLLVVVYNTVQLGGRAQHVIAATVEGNDETRAFTYFLRRQFRHVATTVENESLRFTGDRRSVTCTLRGFRGDPSLHVLHLRALPGGLAAAIRRVEPGSGQPVPTALQSEIGSALRGVEFAFYGTAEDEQEPSWHNQWQPGQRPPRLVRVRYVQPGRRGGTLYLSVAGADGNQVARYTSRGGDS